MKNGFNCKGKCSKVKLGRIRKNKEIESLQQTLCHPMSQTLAKVMNSGRTNNIGLKYQIVKIQGLEIRICCKDSNFLNVSRRQSQMG